MKKHHVFNLFSNFFWKKFKFDFIFKLFLKKVQVWFYFSNFFWKSSSSILFQTFLPKVQVWFCFSNFSAESSSLILFSNFFWHKFKIRVVGQSEIEVRVVPIMTRPHIEQNFWEICTIVDSFWIWHMTILCKNRCKRKRIRLVWTLTVSFTY